MGTTKKRMTVGVLEDELVKVRQGLSAVIKGLKARDRREPITRVAGGGPKPCIIVEWGECCYGRTAGKAATTKTIAPALHSLALCLGRLARYIDEHNEP